ncbi:hypothetical protein [Hymenobacter cavernae]|nr:hypothetical protein [Hymenobacter cavernae]
MSKDILSGRVSKDAVVEAVLQDGQVRFENVDVQISGVVKPRFLVVE